MMTVIRQKPIFFRKFDLAKPGDTRGFGEREFWNGNCIGQLVKKGGPFNKELFNKQKENPNEYHT